MCLSIITESSIWQIIDIHVTYILIMSKISILRSWYYLRIGWTTYLTFFLAAINSLVVTYYLAIKELPVLEQIFPSIFHYAIIITSILIPVMSITGYIYFKKSPQFTSEADILIESNPHWNRILKNTDVVLSTHNNILKYLIKKYSEENLSDHDVEQFHQFKNELENYSKRKTLP
jgi:hypothetical protein